MIHFSHLILDKNLVNKFDNKFDNKFVCCGNGCKNCVLTNDYFKKIEKRVNDHKKINKHNKK
jgi:hypothetical protein